MPPSSSEGDDSSGLRRLAHQIMSRASTSGSRKRIRSQIDPELMTRSILLLGGAHCQGGAAGPLRRLGRAAGVAGLAVADQRPGVDPVERSHAEIANGGDV